MAITLDSGELARLQQATRATWPTSGTDQTVRRPMLDFRVPAIDVAANGTFVR